MAKDKERSINPAQQQRKLDKAKALKKGKAEIQARRNEKLARRNPERLQRQVDDLKALEESGQIKPREKQILEELQRDLRAVRKAREVLGERAPQFGNRNNSGGGNDKEGGLLGKRKWDGKREEHGQNRKEENSGSETDESVRKIPMPKDTPPPIPQQNRLHRHGTNANLEPLGEGRGGGERQPHDLPAKPAAVSEVKRVYESAPQIRDLKKEAVGRFVPTVVRKKQEAVKGVGGLVEPEELDRLEKEGYAGKSSTVSPMNESENAPASSTIPLNAVTSIDTQEEVRRLAEEEERFRREMRLVEIEEVEDEDL